MEPSTLTFETISQHSQEFYQQIYVVQTLGRDELIDLGEFSTDRPVIVVDSCGWYYQKMFPQHNIRRMEGITTCKNMNLDRSRVDILFDDRDKHLSFPKISLDNAVLILDHSVLLKYRTPSEVHEILNRLTVAIPCTDIYIRMALLYSNDNRFQDRLQQQIKILPAGYTVVKFNLDLNAKYQPLIAHFRKNTEYESSVY